MPFTSTAAASIRFDAVAGEAKRVLRLPHHVAFGRDCRRCVAVSQQHASYVDEHVAADAAASRSNSLYPAQMTNRKT
jgi:hypothetical protein